MDRTRELFQGAIALCAVLGAVAITVVLLVEGKPLDAVPAWLTLLIGAIAGTYFGASGVASGVAKGSNGVVQAARQIVQSQQYGAQAASQVAPKPEEK